MSGKVNSLLNDEIACANKMIDRLDRKIKKESGSSSFEQNQTKEEEEEDIVIRIRDLLIWYIKKAARAKNTYYRCSMLIIGIPLFVAVINTVKTASGPWELWLSVLITALSGLTSFMSSYLVLSRCQESWIRYRNCAEDIKDELDFYLNDAGLYAPWDEEGKPGEKRSSQILSEQILNITQKERKQWTDMRNSHDTKK